MTFICVYYECIALFVSLNDNFLIPHSDRFGEPFGLNNIFIHRKYIHVSTIHNGTGSDSKQRAYM